jgi:hypothetical protein
MLETNEYKIHQDKSFILKQCNKGLMSWSVFELDNKEIISK